MPKFHSAEHEANWRAAMAKRKAKVKNVDRAVKPNAEPNGINAVLKGLRSEHDAAKDRVTKLAHAIEVLSAIAP